MPRLVPQGHYLNAEFFCAGSERITLKIVWDFFLSFFPSYFFLSLFLNGPHSRIHLHGLMAYQMAINDAFSEKETNRPMCTAYMQM